MSTEKLNGLPQAVITYLTTIMGVETDEDLKHLKEADLVEAGLKPIPARKFLAEAGATPATTGPTDITVRLDRGERPVAELDEPEELLAVLASKERPVADRKTAARKLSEMGRRIVVSAENRKELLVDQTAAYWKKGSLRAAYWGRNNDPVISATSLFETDEKVEIDPYELVRHRRLVALDGGYNAESGADWAKVSMRRRALLIAASLAGEQVAQGDSVSIAETLSLETLGGKWKVLDQRADAERLTELEKTLTVPLAAVATPDSIQASAALTVIFGSAPSSAGSAAVTLQTTKLTGGQRFKQFHDYILRAHSHGDLLMHFDEMRADLPERSSLNDLAFQFIGLAERTSRVQDPEFWNCFLRARPGRAAEVRALAQSYGVTI